MHRFQISEGEVTEDVGFVSRVGDAKKGDGQRHNAGGPTPGVERFFEPHVVEGSGAYKTEENPAQKDAKNKESDEGGGVFDKDGDLHRGNAEGDENVREGTGEANGGFGVDIGEDAGESEELLDPHSQEEGQTEGGEAIGAHVGCAQVAEVVAANSDGEDEGDVEGQRIDGHRREGFLTERFSAVLGDEASTKFGGEVFNRGEQSLLQRVEGGDTGGVFLTGRGANDPPESPRVALALTRCLRTNIVVAAKS